MNWTRAAAWVLVGAEALALAIAAIFGTDRIGGVAIHVALLALSLAVAAGISRRASLTPEVKPTQRVDPPSAEAVATTDPLDNRAWVSLVEECVQLLDEVDRDFEHADATRKQVASHVVLRLGEILERADVEVIDGETTYDRLRHQAPKAAPGMPVAETLSPGYAIGRRVLRRAKVVVRPD